MNDLLKIDPELIKKVGTDPSILFACFEQESKNAEEDGWFPLPCGEVNRRIGMSYQRQYRYLPRLVKEGLVEVCRRGLPGIRWVRIVK